jgi:hypothetical protein
MRCENCHQADLTATTFLYERVDSAGTGVRREVDGFECPNCADRVLRGRDAELISSEWFAIQGGGTGVSVSTDPVSTGIAATA